MFLTSLKAEGDRSPWGDFWFQPVGQRGNTIRVDHDSALRLSAVYACVRVLAEALAIMPFVLYKEGPKGARIRVKKHPIYKLFTKSPNRYQNAFEFKEMLMGHIVLRGNAFCEIFADKKGEILELIPLHPDRVKIEVLQNGNYRYVVTGADGSTRTINRGDMWHLRGLSSDGIIGLNPIELARENIGLGLQAQAYGARFFANDARPSGGWIEYPGRFKDQEAKDQFKSSWQKAQGGTNKGKIAVLESGMKFHELGVTNDDAQFLETRQFQIPEVCRLFKVPPHLIADLSRATFSNIEQQDLNFFIHTMLAWVVRFSSSIENQLLFEDEGLEADFDFKVLLRGDSAARSTYYNNGINAGWLTRNEARISEGLDPIEGLDDPLRPLNMVKESEADDLQDDQEANEVPEDDAQDAEDETENETDSAAAARFNSLLSAVCDRIITKECASVNKLVSADAGIAELDQFYEKHAIYVAKSLNISLENAAKYCEESKKILISEAFSTEKHAKFARSVLFFIGS